MQPVLNQLIILRICKNQRKFESHILYRKSETKYIYKYFPWCVYVIKIKFIPKKLEKSILFFIFVVLLLVNAEQIPIIK